MNKSSESKVKFRQANNSCKRVVKLATPVKSGEGQQNKQKQNKTKISIFAVVFLIQYFC